MHDQKTSYKATVTTSNTVITKHYIGMTSRTFKQRSHNWIFWAYFRIMVGKQLKQIFPLHTLHKSSRFCTPHTYFLVEGKTSATAAHLALFMAGRHSHEELPIVKHSTEFKSWQFSSRPPTTTNVFSIITAQQQNLFSNMDGKTLVCPVLQLYIITFFKTFSFLSRPPNKTTLSLQRAVAIRFN